MSDSCIVVIGEVTRNQYQPLRLYLMQCGFRPKIVRVDKSIACSTVNMMLLDQVDGAGEEYFSNISFKRQQQILQEVIEKVIGFSCTAVVGLVMSEDAWVHKDNVFVNDVLDEEALFPEMKEVHVVRPSGNVEIVVKA